MLERSMQGFPYHAEPSSMEHIVPYWFGMVRSIGGVPILGLLNQPHTGMVIGWHRYEAQYLDGKPWANVYKSMFMLSANSYHLLFHQA